MNVDNETKVIKRISKDLRSLDLDGLKRVTIYIFEMLEDLKLEHEKNMNNELKLIEKIINDYRKTKQ